MRAIFLTILLSILCFEVSAQKRRAEYVWGVEATYSQYADRWENADPLFALAHMNRQTFILYRTIVAREVGKRPNRFSKVLSHKSKFALDVGLGLHRLQYLRSQIGRAHV